MPPSPALVDRVTLIGGTGTNKVMAGELSRLVKRGFDDVRLPEPKKEGQGALLYPFHREVARSTPPRRRRQRCSLPHRHNNLPGW